MSHDGKADCDWSMQEYLEMQRQLAIQRLQEQEKERQMRLEQQKHTIQMRAQMPVFSLPYAQVPLLYIVHNLYSTPNFLQVCWELEHSYICSWVIVDAVSAS